MEALLVAQLVFAACDTPSLEADLVACPARVASDLSLPSTVTAAASGALQQDVELKSLIWI